MKPFVVSNPSKIRTSVEFVFTHFRLSSSFWPPPTRKRRNKTNAASMTLAVTMVETTSAEAMEDLEVEDSEVEDMEVSEEAAAEAEDSEAVDLVVVQEAAGEAVVVAPL